MPGPHKLIGSTSALRSFVFRHRRCRGLYAAYPSVQLHNTIYVVITQYEPRKVHRLLMRSIEYLYFTDTVLQSQLHD